MNWHRWHSLCNALLLCVAIVLTITNRYVIQPTVSQGTEVRRELVDVTSVATEQQHLQAARNVNKLPCSAAVQCFVGNSSVFLAADGPPFHRWDSFFGEPWTSRQMFVEVRGVAREPARIPSSSAWMEDGPLTFESPDFRVGLHVETVRDRGCSGVFAVLRKRAQPQMCTDGGHCIRDESTRAFVRNQLQLGDDDFRVRVVGPEIVSTLLLFSTLLNSKGVHRDDAEHSWYVMPFSVATPGQYHLEAEHMYEGFRAFDEASRETIPMVRKPLLPVVESRGSRGQLDGAQHHSPFLNLYVMNHPELGKAARKSKFRSSKHFTWDQFSMRSNVSFLCQGATQDRSPTRQSMIERNSEGCFSLSLVKEHRPRHNHRRVGQWVLSHHNKTFPRNVSPRAAAQLPGHHVHFERSEPQAVYRYHLLESSCVSPHAAILRGFTPSSWHDAMQRRRHYSSTPAGPLTLLFIGDSHMRVTYTHMRNFLVSSTDCPLEDHTVKSMSNKGCLVDVRESFPDRLAQDANKEKIVHVMFSHDVLLHEFVDRSEEQNRFETADVVVLGMGSWAIGGQGSDPNQIARAPADFGRWPLRKYRDVMVTVAARLALLLSRNARLTVVWVTIPAYPPNTRRFAKLKGEHRTNARIFAMNRIAQEVLSSHVPVKFHERVRVVDAFDVTYPVMHLSLDHNHFTTYPQDAIVHLLLNALV